MARIPELAQRDRFVRRAVAEGRVLTLADEEHASVASQKYAGRVVQLFWSSPREARRWAEALCGDPALQEISLASFASDILPGLAMAKGLAGTDWVSDPIEAEVDPRDLLLRLKGEALGGHLADMSTRGEVFLVAGADGPMLQPAAGRGGSGHAVHVFASRLLAEAQLKAVGGRSVIADLISDFRASTLPWAAERGHLVAFFPIEGAGAIEIAAAEAGQRLSRA